MWAAEPRKTLFALLAQAYTDIRDNHLENVQLDKFLASTVHRLPVIPADKYLSKMGWDLALDTAGQATITRSTKFNADAVLSEYPAHTDKSSGDLVNHCYEVGLLKQSSRVFPRTQALCNIMTMPTAPAPTIPVQAQAATFEDPEMFDVRSLELFCLHTLTLPQFEAQLARIEADAAASGPTSEFNFNDPIVNLRPDYRPSIDAVTADQQRAYERTPFFLHFHPEIQPPVLGFDPNMVQDEFDPFSLFDLSK